MARDVVMIHGAFAGGWYFGWLRAAFEERGWRVRALNLRHHGGGYVPRELAQVGLEDYRADLTDLLRQYDEPPVLVGHSMGGLLAQQLASDGRAAAAVLLAPSAPWGIFPTSPHEYGTAMGLLQQGDYWNRIMVPDRQIAMTLALDRMDGELREQAMDLLGPESGRAIFQTIHWGLDFSMGSAVDHRKVECPVLCVAGTADQAVSTGTVRSVARKYHKVSTYEEVPRLSHFIAGEPAAKGLPDLVLSWLDDVL
jgi:pimeloyl-ACP methyl ester carboxylesterase